MNPQICRYVRQTGRRCGSPALRGKLFCYFHNQSSLQRKRERQLADEGVQGEITREVDAVFRRHGIVDDLTAEYFGYIRHPIGQVDFPPLEDRASIQIALSTLLQALGHGVVTPKLAGVMLYNLKIASQNLRGLDINAPTVTETISDDLGNVIAVDEEDGNSEKTENLPANPEE